MADGMTAEFRLDMDQVVVTPYGATPIRLATHPDVTDASLRDRIRDGQYEVHERRAVESMLVEGDVLVELGAGVGLISTTAYKTGLPAEIHCYEADPRMPDLIRETHRLNGVRGVNLTVAAVTAYPAAVAAGWINIHLRSSFWANSIHSPDSGRAAQKVRVPAISLSAIVEKVRPTVIVCDIEGAEIGLFDDVDLSGVRHVLVELHPNVTGPGSVRRVFGALHREGLIYDCALSNAAVPGFTRV
jgi:FkbM family methyltransferase